MSDPKNCWSDWLQLNEIAPVFHSAELSKPLRGQEEGFYS